MRAEHAKPNAQLPVIRSWALFFPAAPAAHSASAATFPRPIRFDVKYRLMSCPPLWKMVAICTGVVLGVASSVAVGASRSPREQNATVAPAQHSGPFVPQPVLPGGPAEPVWGSRDVPPEDAPTVTDQDDPAAASGR